ncbi:MAG TPA: dihydroorotate dehydrogenase-like protein [Bacteroidales bacterium]|nr:dihydroorotate dehydrogenase-like protein [Bacteroidales bacterium]
MSQLETTYLGLKLKNPVIVGSSGLTSSIDKIKEIEKQGAGAIVLKSLFEEQINYEAGSLAETSDSPEALDYVKYYTKNNTVQEYLDLIKKAKEEVDIPVIASINCVSAKDWVDFAKQIENAGADALEVNVFILPNDRNASGEKYEEIYFDLADKLKKILTIPFAFKLGSHFTNLVGFIQKLHVPGVVLFNRFYAPDIDVHHMKFVASEVFSSPSDNRDTLRWVGIVSSKISRLDIAASTGIHDGEAVVKQILAGAKVVQVCSTLYKNGISHLENILKDLESWMDEKGFEHVDEFRGKMSYHRIEDPLIYERSQFMKYFSSIH